MPFAGPTSPVATPEAGWRTHWPIGVEERLKGHFRLVAIPGQKEPCGLTSRWQRRGKLSLMDGWHGRGEDDDRTGMAGMHGSTVDARVSVGEEEG